MATIRKVIDLQASAAAVWDVLRDVGAVHTRLAPGFVVDTQLEPGARVVKFVNGVVAKELVVGLDPDLRRLAYAVVDSTLVTHHSASFEVVPTAGGGSQLVWTTDFLPDTAATMLRPMIEKGSTVMQLMLNALRG